MNFYLQAIGGIYEEFIAGGRLDNLVSTYCSIRALIDSSSDVSGETMIRIAACYDNEEVRLCKRQ